MARHRGPVLVDTNVIIECWRVSAWWALTGGYQVETVQMCEIETQTGLQRRRREQQIDATELRRSLKAVHAVSDSERAAAFLLDDQFSFLDAGEQMLWSHALTRADAWVLCGPDKASLRLGIRLGFRERLVALERLLLDAGFRSKDLRDAYTQRWLDKTLTELALLEGKRPRSPGRPSPSGSVRATPRTRSGPRTRGAAGQTVALLCGRVHRTDIRRRRAGCNRRG
jgi:hypothetical protein